MRRNENPSARHRHFLPQQLLLRASFIQGESAVTAWERWRSQVDLEGHVDPVSFRLLAHLGRNLAKQGVNDAMAHKLRGISRHNWCRNQPLLRKYIAPVHSLQEAAIEAIVLDEPAIALRYDPDVYLGHAMEFPLLVRVEQAESAFKQLWAAGWLAVSRLSEGRLKQYVSDGSAHLFQDAAGNRIRLYWRLLPIPHQVNSDNELWERSVSKRMCGTPIRTLSPTNQFLLACVPGAVSLTTPRVLRAAHAMMVFERSRSEINWQQMIDLAQRRLWLASLGETVAYIQATLDAPLPEGWSDRTWAMPNVKWHRRAFRVRILWQTLWGRFLGLRFHYAQENQRTGRVMKLIGIPLFLRDRWRLGHWSRLPACLVGKVLWQIRQLR